MNRLLIILAVDDALLTLACVNDGVTEANPLMRHALAMGPVAFVAIKLLVAAVGAAFLREKAPRALAFLCGCYFAVCLGSIVALWGSR